MIINDVTFPTMAPPIPPPRLIFSAPQPAFQLKNQWLRARSLALYNIFNGQ